MNNRMVAKYPPPDVAATLRHAIELNRSGRLSEAEPLYRLVLERDPDNPDALCHLGVILHQKGDSGAGIELLHRALSAYPDLPNALSNLGIVHKDLGDLDKAVACYRRAIALDPSYAFGHYNLGNALFEQREITEAASAYRHAIACDSNLASAHYNLSLCLLLQGELTDGWREYEWRWASPESETPRSLQRPLWNGEPLDGKTILLYAEQGYGDTLHFARYVPLVADRGARVVLEAPDSLSGLLGSLAGLDEIVSPGDPAPQFDFQAPLLRLPYVFGTTLETIPATTPYLSISRATEERWSRRLRAYGGLLVGVVWAGRASHKRDAERSIPLSDLRPLLDLKGVQFFSLQFGARSGEIDEFGLGSRMVDLSADIADFEENAAAIRALDLVVTVDTATAHLAGTLAKPVVILLSYVPDWRWLLDRDDSPWYPTARLLRQPRAGDWPTVVERLGEILAARTRA